MIASAEVKLERKAIEKNREKLQQILKSNPFTRSKVDQLEMDVSLGEPQVFVKKSHDGEEKMVKTIARLKKSRRILLQRNKELRQKAEAAHGKVRLGEYTHIKRNLKLLQKQHKVLNFEIKEALATNKKDAAQIRHDKHEDKQISDDGLLAPV